MNMKIVSWILAALLIAMVQCRPTADENDNDDDSDLFASELSEEITDEEIKEAVRDYMVKEEHRLLRKVLKHALKLIDEEDEEIDDDLETLASDMPFYVEHIKSLVDGAGEKRRHKSHRRRGSGFDSISHQGGIDGFGGNSRRYSFESILPYIIRHMSKKS